MSSEGAAFQAANQRHNRYMMFGKKQRYIEVFQCSGEDMNKELIGSNTPTAAVAGLAALQASMTSPPPPHSALPASLPPSASSAGGKSSGPGTGGTVSPATTGSTTSVNMLPPGMFTAGLPQVNAGGNPPQAQQTANTLGAAGAGLDPLTASLVAQQQQLLMSQGLLRTPTAPPAQIAQPAAAAGLTGSTADVSALLGLNPAAAAAAQVQAAQFLPAAQAFNPALLGLAARPPQLGSLQANAFNMAAAANAAQQQLQQQQLLQSQLAAQRLLYPGSAATAQTAGLLPRPILPGGQTKRSYEQAFTGSASADAASAAAGVSGAKRPSYGLGTPTISAGPTTYNR